MATISFRTSGDWIDGLDRIGDLLESRISENRSGLIRELITRDSYLWLDAPYIATSMSAFVFVHAEGDMFLSITQELLLQESQHTLPTRISMKPEKEHEFEERAGDKAPAKHIRENWLINHFAAWQGKRGPRLDQQVDDHGITTKSCDLVVNTPQDSLITREILVGVRDYVMRSTPGDIADDRASISLHIPTAHLQAGVVVDLDLFSETQEKRHTAKVDFELRNQEDALIRRKWYHSEVNSNRWHTGRHPRGSFRQAEAKRECTGMFNGFRRRIHELAKGNVGDQPIVKNKQHRERLLGIEQPKEFLFGLFEWPMPPVGLKVCLTWNKPDPRE